jgi:lysophospholipase L1-like esterase
MPSRRAAGGLAAVLLLLLAVPAATPAAERGFHVSLGDSYATGYQATGPGEGKATRRGYANQLREKARRRGYELRLVSFGCGGETTKSILRRTAPCTGPAVGGRRYGGRTQAAAAARFLRRHRGHVRLVTVSIGGNDVTACAGDAEPIPCVADAVEAIERNVGRLARRLRAAAGPRVRLVGLTYPDVVLAEWVRGRQDLARLSVVAFRELINPALKDAYASAGGRLVDVTAATGAYGPFEDTVDLPPYGVLPVPVAEVCRLTYACEEGDIHARTEGYELIAELIARALPRR